MCKLILEHWAMFQECVARNLPMAKLVKRTWAVSWDKLARGKQRWSLAAGPIAAMQCYLMDLGFDASTMDHWTRGDVSIQIEWGNPKVGTIVRQHLNEVLRKDRWNRIASQELANGAQDGIDWTVPRRMLKRANKQPLIASGLRMLWQGAIRRANHGGDLLCPRCGKENSLAHVLHECVKWGSFDLGRDPAWEAAFPNAPDCFKFRGLVPLQATRHPMIAPEKMAIRRTGIFAGEFLPDPSICFGTDASGGPRGEDPRLRVVSWAVVAIRVDFRGPTQAYQLKYEVIGMMSGTLQIGATAMTVNRSP